MPDGIELAKAYVQIIPSAKGIKGNIEKELGGEIDKAGENAGKSFSTAFGGALKVAGAAITAATGAVAAFGAESVKVGAAFDTSMAQVAATMGTTVDSIQDLRAFAQEMGSATAFSASQAADALNYMALAGYDAETSMKMLPNVLNLAAAGGIELAAASDMVTDAQSALGISLDETSALVDKMAKASSKSNTSVAQLGEAILTVGGTAKNLAGGTTELSTALGILADNGIKGAEGGTALRNIILSLAAPTDKAAAAMDAMGLSAYDASGNLRPMEDIFTDLNGILSTMTQGEQTEVLNTLFNKVDLKSANALLATTTERWGELSGAIDDASGAAAQMAETQLDNLSGDITLFQSALEGAQIAISEGLMPELRAFVQYGSSAISDLTSAFKEKGLGGAMDALGTALSNGLSMIMQKLPVFVDAGMQLLGAIGEGIIQNLPVMLESALQIIVSLASGIAQSLPQLVPSIVDVMMQIVDTLTEPSTLGMLIGAALAIIVGLANGLMSALPNLIPKTVEIVAQLVAGIITNAPKMAIAAAQMIAALLQGIGATVVQLVQKGGELVDAVKSGVMAKVNDAKNWGRDLISNFISGIRAKWDSLKSTVGQTAASIKAYLGFSEPETGPLSNFHTFAPDMIDLWVKGIRQNIGAVENASAYMADAVATGFEPNMDSNLVPALTASGNAVRGLEPAGEMYGGGEQAWGGEYVFNLTTTLDGAVVARNMYRYNAEEVRRRGMEAVE